MKLHYYRVSASSPLELPDLGLLVLLGLLDFLVLLGLLDFLDFLDFLDDLDLDWLGILVLGASASVELQITALSKPQPVPLVQLSFNSSSVHNLAPMVLQASVASACVASGKH